MPQPQRQRSAPSITDTRVKVQLKAERGHVRELRAQLAVLLTYTGTGAFPHIYESLIQAQRCGEGLPKFLRSV